MKGRLFAIPSARCLGEGRKLPAALRLMTLNVTHALQLAPPKIFFAKGFSRKCSQKKGAILGRSVVLTLAVRKSRFMTAWNGHVEGLKTFKP